jgi:pimeloyl-ACP methyl ester carboxylesterase
VPRFLALGDRFARGCRRKTPRFLLRHLTTADTARDMDLMRRAVGDAKLTYVGRSYGTELGAVYASLFPKRVRALVLDGGINHKVWVGDPLGGPLGFAAGNEAALGRFFAFCGATPDACPFADGNPEASFDGVLAELDKSPLPGSGSDPRPLNATLGRIAALAAMYDPSAWPLLGAGLENADGGDGALLRALADAFVGRMPDGRYTNALEAQLVITANDAKFPRARGTYEGHLRQLNEKAPHFANVLMGFDSSPRRLAAGFDAYRKPLRYPASSPTILVVGATGDNATPYPDSQALTRQLGNARLLTREGDGHTSFGSSDCIDNAIRAYLIEGTLPPEGTTCARGT